MHATKLEILHDHHKDSFHYIRELEKARDRQFIILILVMGLLFLAVQFPDYLRSLLQGVKIGAGEVDVSKLPLSIVTSALWAVFWALAVRYCQSSINVERKYDYLHNLEETIGDILENKNIYCREGKAYLDKYPAFSSWTYFYYTRLFPILVMLLTGYLWYLEYQTVKRQCYYLIFDAVTASGVLISFFLYRIWPLLTIEEQSDAHKND